MFAPVESQVSVPLRQPVNAMRSEPQRLRTTSCARKAGPNAVPVALTTSSSTISRAPAMPLPTTQYCVPTCVASTPPPPPAGTNSANVAPERPPRANGNTSPWLAPSAATRDTLSPAATNRPPSPSGPMPAGNGRSLEYTPRKLPLAA